jgi:hypothetical protein
LLGDIGNFIFSKGGKQVLRSKAIGIVINNTIKKVRNLGHCLGVRWLQYGADKITELEFTKEEFDAGYRDGLLSTKNTIFNF